MPTAQKPHAKFFGRKAVFCRRCGGSRHYVNKMGGVVCSKCSPPKDLEADSRCELEIEGGVWVDSEDQIEMFDVSILIGVASATSPVGPVQSPAPAPSAAITSSISNSENSPIWSRFSRGPHGELSEFEFELYASDRIWQNADEFIILRSLSKRLMEPPQDPTCQGAVVFKRRTKKKEERRSQDNIACRGALQDRIKAEALSARLGDGRRSGCEGDASQDSGESDLEKFQVGEIVRVTRRVATFRGPLSPDTDYRLLSVWRDQHDLNYVNLGDARTDELVLCGLDLGGIRKV